VIIASILNIDWLMTDSRTSARPPISRLSGKSLLLATTSRPAVQSIVIRYRYKRHRD
jgi:hypothetical protein